MEDMDVSGFDLTFIKGKERRRRRELAASAEMDELQSMLLPLDLALARLSARTLLRGARQ